MPGKKQMRRSRQRKGGKSKDTIHWGVISPTTMTTLAYPYLTTLTESSVSAGAYYTFGLNRLYDPDVTSTGQQPIGFDQMCALYNRFRVIKTDVRLIFTNVNSLTNSGTVGHFETPASLFPSSSLAWQVQRMGQWNMLAPTSSCKTVEFNYSVNMWDVAGVPKSVYMADLSYTGTSTADPTSQLYTHTWARGIVAIANVAVAIELRYHVEWSEPVAMALS